MRKCNVCKKNIEDSLFIKINHPGFFKLCIYCRNKNHQTNQAKKDKKSNQSKEYYEKNKIEIKEKNRKWREANKEKLKEYERSPFRKEQNKKWRARKKKEDHYRFILYAAKRRAKDKNIPFNISKQDIVDIYPTNNRCPILGLELKLGMNRSTDYSPSIDRKIPELGYVKNNIQIISYRANRIKNDASLEELHKIVSFLKEDK